MIADTFALWLLTNRINVLSTRITVLALFGAEHEELERLLMELSELMEQRSTRVADAFGAKDRK